MHARPVGRATDADIDATGFRRIADRVLDQVGDQLLEAISIADHDAAAVCHQRHPPSLGPRPRLLDHLADQLGHIDGFVLKTGRLASVGSRQQQQVADQPAHARGFFFGFDDRFAPSRFRDTLAAQQSEIAADDGDRVAQLVGRVGEQAAL